MISTGTLMLGKALLTASAALGLCFWQLWVLRRDKRRRESDSRDRPDESPADHSR
ncbi:hypothetical protein [Thiorhodococcus minor]|uniref:Uncharacterized protein n=1 Tax=Thiorhodococcus minor TaxID=57489 RepID=A0A6M0JSV4_9GAMM|nr:hypothetical protein [Thiorhodococcus minor]NEV60582.1 hypothetical protein [Thiorhodococcus minor]